MNPSEVWAQSSSYPARAGNALELYVDGQAAFAAIADAIRQAKQYVYATFAYIEPKFCLEPDKTNTTILQLLSIMAKSGVDVRILIWSPETKTPGTIPDSDSSKLFDINAGQGTIKARWDVAIPPFIGCHHQKSFVIDGQIAFVGGINSLQAYWDTNEHVPDDLRRLPFDVKQPMSESAFANVPPLHDLFGHIQGFCVNDVEANFCERWNNATYKHSNNQNNDVIPHTGAVANEANLTLQITRTLAPLTYHTKPSGETSIRETYLKAINAAEHMIYFENQYYFDDDVDRAILDAAKKGVKVIGLLCLKPDENTSLGFVEKAIEDIGKTMDDFDNYFTHNNIILFSPVKAMNDPLTNNYIYTDIYVHAKLLIVDDQFMTLGSANISNTSMQFHSEMNLVANDTSKVRLLHKQLWEEHFQRSLTDMQLFDPNTAVNLWNEDAKQNFQARNSSQKPVSRVYPFTKVLR